MRIVSLQPSITVTLAGLGVLRDVVACTRYCKDVCPEIAQGSQLILTDSWSAQCDEIVAARPEIVIASVPYRIESLAEILKAGVRVLALAPKDLEDVYSDIRTLAALVDRASAGEGLVTGLQEEVAATQDRTQHLVRQRVYCEAWGKPLTTSPKWVAELVDAAGGEFIGEPGKEITAQAVAEADPEVILAAWCGAGNRVPLQRLMQREGWAQTTAARERRIYAVPDELFNTPAHTLTGGLRAIRWALHPRAFWRPTHIRSLDDAPFEGETA